MTSDDHSSIIRISNVLNLTRQEFTVIEKHILHCILKDLKEQQSLLILDVENKEPISLVIDASDVLKNSKNTTPLRDALKKITTRNLFFDFSKPKSEYFGSITPFSYASYEAKQGTKAKINIDINYKCKKLFLELAKGYTNLQLDAIITLKSEYSIRMYELISMFLRQGAWTVKIEKLRDLLNLEQTKYKNYGMFEKRILLYSQKELWEHCNLHFEWEIAEKKGKKITALTFHIKERDKQERVELNEEIKQTIDYVKSLSPIQVANTYNMIMSKYNLSQKQADYIFTDNNRLNEFIRVDLIIEDKIVRGKAPIDRTKYLAKSLGLDKVKFKESQVNKELFR
jgi:plasmid replication initiation protein